MEVIKEYYYSISGQSHMHHCADHHVFINPQVKVVLNKCTIYPFQLAKNYSTQLF